MKQLRSLQHHFQDYLIGISNEIQNDITSTENALAEHRLGTYYNAYRIRLIDALAVDYAAIEKHLGREVFENLALDYLKKFPSKQASIRWFGQHLPKYFSDYCDREDQKFLFELAQFEWAQGLVFDADNEANLFRIEDMAQVPAEAWSGLVVKFKPAMLWLDLHWNICPYAVALDEGEVPPAKHREEIPKRWLLWRKNHNPNWRSLEVHEAWTIEVMHQGANFAELCEGLCEWISEDQVAITAAGLLKQWVSDELVTTLDY